MAERLLSQVVSSVWVIGLGRIAKKCSIHYFGIEFMGSSQIAIDYAEIP